MINPATPRPPVHTDATKSAGLLVEVGTTMARNTLRRDRHRPGGRARSRT